MLNGSPSHLLQILVPRVYAVQTGHLIQFWKLRNNQSGMLAHIATEVCPVCGAVYCYSAA
jgi:hypothetical protein